MSGEVWAVIAGVGFGIFQSVNRRAVSGMDVYLATFLQLLISALVLSAACLATLDLSVLGRMSLGTLINFGLAGLLHFFTGWTFLNMSQKAIGAARTSPLIGATPLFAALVASVTLGEFPDALAWLGILVMSGGVYVVSVRATTANPTTGAPARTTLLRGSLAGLAAALCWAISPIFIREGLKEVDVPLLGVTIGMLASVIAYGLPLLARRVRRGPLSASNEALFFKITAGVLVGLSTWARWIALDGAGVAVVLALSMISVPIVIWLSPLISGRQHEPVTVTLWAGAGLVIGGALVLILHP